MGRKGKTLVKRVIRSSEVYVLGRIWMPMVPGATTIQLSDYDIKNLEREDGKITRRSVESWLGTHAGDFSEILDFSASIEDGEVTVDLPWANEDNGQQWGDLMFPSEDD